MDVWCVLVIWVCAKWCVCMSGHWYECMSTLLLFCDMFVPEDDVKLLKLNDFLFSVALDHVNLFKVRCTHVHMYREGCMVHVLLTNRY